MTIQQKKQKNDYQKLWRKNNPGKTKEANKRAKAKIDPIVKSLYTALWIEKNKKSWNKYQNEYHKKRRLIDPEFKDRLNASNKKWVNKNRSLVNKKVNESSKKRYANDPEYKSMILFRDRIYREDKNWQKRKIVK